MSALERQQRGLLALLKSRGAPPDDPYLRRVAQSRELALVREIALWWRAFALEAQCRFTSRLLKRLGCFEARVACYFDHNATSPFVEELSLSFLGSLNEDADPLIRATARFEHALLAVRVGAADTYEIVWDRHPDRVALALETGGALPAPEPDRVYRMRVAVDLPNLVACTCEPVVLPGAEPDAVGREDLGQRRDGDDGPRDLPGRDPPRGFGHEADERGAGPGRAARVTRRRAHGMSGMFKG